MCKCQVLRSWIPSVASLLLSLLLLTLFFHSFADAHADSGGTITGGVIVSDTTWMVQNSPYMVTSNLLIDQGVVLTVEAGVEVRFAQNTSMQVTGTLRVQGTASQPITFTSAQSEPKVGDWQGIHISNPYASPLSEFASMFDYLTLEYAGAPTDGDQYVLNGSASVRNSHFRYNGGGIRITGADPEIDNNQFYSNIITIRNVLPIEGSMILVIGDHSIIERNQILNNEFHFVGSSMHGVEGGIISCGNRNIVFNNKVMNNSTNLPDVFVGVGVTGNGSTAEFNTIQDNAGIGLRVGLIWECDNYNQPSIGAWDNLVQRNVGDGIYGSTLNSNLSLVNNQIISNGGDGIFLRQGEYRIENNRVISNSGVGVNLIAVTGTLTYNHIDANQQGGVSLEESAPRLVHNDLSDNGGYNLKNNSQFNGTHLDAKNNWWGSTESSTIQSTIIDWNDDARLNAVDFEPFLMRGIDQLYTLYMPVVSR